MLPLVKTLKACAKVHALPPAMASVRGRTARDRDPFEGVITAARGFLAPTNPLCLHRLRNWCRMEFHQV